MMGPCGVRVEPSDKHCLLHGFASNPAAEGPHGHHAEIVLSGSVTESRSTKKERPTQLLPRTALK